jgi:hypothetical protein
MVQDILRPEPALPTQKHSFSYERSIAHAKRVIVRHNHLFLGLRKCVNTILQTKSAHRSRRRTLHRFGPVVSADVPPDHGFGPWGFAKRC